MNKEELYDLVVNKKYTLKQIGQIYSCDAANVCYYIKKYGIKKIRLKSEDPLKQWIFDNCFNINGKLNNQITKVEWWTKYQDKLYEIKQLFPDINDISQSIYHIINGPEIGKCKTCQTPTEFMQYHSGYRQYCSLYCVTQGIERNNKIGKHPNRKVAIENSYKSNLVDGTHFFVTEKFKEKSKKTKMLKYNDEFYNNIDKTKETNLLKYGKEFYYQTDNFKHKASNTKLLKYGTLVPPNNWKSKEEQEVLDFVNSLTDKYKFSKNKTILKNREIDLYCDDLKFGVEYNGLYAHCELSKDNNYHYDKWKRCNDQGIQLLTIFSDEWNFKKDVVKNFLKSKIGVFDQRLYARNCEFKELYDFKEVNDLLHNNHLQGVPNMIKRAFGLFYEGVIIGCVTFSLHHRNSKDFVLNRMVFKSGIQVVGGASRLIKKSLEILNSSIITWSDNRWSTGIIYEKSGFIFDGELKPDYSYYKNNIEYRIPKQKMKKKNIGCPNHLTEHEFCNSLGFYRIYDCGKKRWRFNGN